MLYPVGVTCSSLLESLALPCWNHLFFPDGTTCSSLLEPLALPCWNHLLPCWNHLLFPVGVTCSSLLEPLALPCWSHLLFPIGTSCSSLLESLALPFWNHFLSLSLSFTFFLGITCFYQTAGCALVSARRGDRLLVRVEKTSIHFAPTSYWCGEWSPLPA